MPPEEQETGDGNGKHKAHGKCDRHHHQHRADLEIAGQQGHDIAGTAEEESLTETHDPGIAEDEIEAQRKQGQD
jgi:hypothetical protein